MGILNEIYNKRKNTLKGGDFFCYSNFDSRTNQSHLQVEYFGVVKDRSRVFSLELDKVSFNKETGVCDEYEIYCCDGTVRYLRYDVKKVLSGDKKWGN
jgi:hypothetical protein